MQAWAPLILAGAALLVVAGLPKLARPASTVTALRSVGATRVGAGTVRALALTEIATGLCAITIGDRATTAAVGLLYAGFCGFLIRALGTPAASCGCTARADTPPTVSHLVLTAMFLAGAIAAAVAGGSTGIGDVVQHSSAGQAAAAIGLASLVAWLGWAVLTVPLSTKPAAQPSVR